MLEVYKARIMMLQPKRKQQTTVLQWVFTQLPIQTKGRVRVGSAVGRRGEGSRGNNLV